MELRNGKVWIWIRVPLTALIAAIDALKERAMARHREAAGEADREKAKALRQAADENEQSAEDLKLGHREWEEDRYRPHE
jgi:hypothetical protein